MRSDSVCEHCHPSCTLHSPACGRGVGERAGASMKSNASVCHRRPSPPAPLPQAGEGSNPLASAQFPAVYNAHPIAAAIAGPDRRTPSWNPRPPA
ncbi:hypothetical protein CBM2589_A90577 [Cupriavidus taiwanensis]|uniref:Uncharacterized protein n=1 Tax=Cupriavidus taiwanensis TaxID=164546 RepID=A0A975XG79_9BURK|nr:hypothetical protein CBM2589_A90577 [Cupriavidus taiwanensis]